MSRVSSKSSLSPSATSGSNAIDLGKDSGVSMGEKSQTSVSTGGIGVTREVANIGGVSVTGGVRVDVSPIRLDISGNPNYEDPNKSSISISAGVEVPGGILGVGGGVTINTSTGQIEGGSIGGEVAGIGIDISKSSEGAGVGISFQIPFTPISLEFGFEFPEKKKEEEKKIEPSTPPKNIPAGYLAGCFVSQKLKRDTENGEGLWRWANGGGLITTSAYRAFFPDSINTARGLWDEPYLEEFHTIPGYVSFYSVYEGSDYLIRNPDITFPFGSFETLYGSFNPIVNMEIRSFKIERSNPVEKFIANANAPFNIVKNKITKGFRRNVVSLPGGERLHDLWARLQGVPWILNSTETYEIVFGCPDGRNPDQKPPELLTIPPPPNSPPRKEMDECCRDSIKLLRQIHKRLGVNKFPGELPSTIIQEVEKGQPATEPVQEKIEDFADLLMWMFQRDDERWGQWQIQIDVKDTDLTKEGDQGKQIKFPNLAESIAEMEGQLLSLQANVAALVALSTRNLCESGMGRQEAIKAYLASMAIAKYMNFPYDESDIKMPSTFTPKAESIDELIKESIIHVKGIEYTNKETQRDILLDLLQAAAITRAVHWRQVDPKKDIKSQILESIKGSADLSDKLENPLAKEDDPSKPKHSKDWEDFLDQVEDGFGFETGIEDAQTPYGRSRERRPRIRQIGDNIGQAGKPNG
ncbi:MAG: hypothetical protein JGK12_05770 [Microcoleus sp. PH2017_01_SCD_O_A]|uniref:hypothetical protein n=1 Tax=Microcoleus sp. PH2017_01_SCD_O_A TaxID=2798812 RepID=UPI001DFEEC50|nr:hypothetical protein [Microcoleus sp. PH2017_01_SCD_O_A]MCC3423438.1 hypothetical protein [Microcoleus sp. PH2017_01_SCD_O_A]